MGSWKASVLPDPHPDPFVFRGPVSPAWRRRGPGNEPLRSAADLIQFGHITGRLRPPDVAPVPIDTAARRHPESLETAISGDFTSAENRYCECALLIEGEITIVCKPALRLVGVTVVGLRIAKERRPVLTTCMTVIQWNS